MLTRRQFVGTAAAAFAWPVTGVRAAAKYKRSLVTSSDGQKALASYAKGVEAMLKLPADDPRNWFRNAFIHLMDCPHGNWWFYVWHRGYLGYFEQTIRSLSGDPEFALPYWDWTELPRIPEEMFDGVLSPTSAVYEPFTGNLAVFTDFIKPALATYWNELTAAQRSQLDVRGYKSLDDLWNGPTGVTAAGVAGNEAFANTCGARFLSKTNPKLDKDTASAVSFTTVMAGLLAPKFYDPVGDQNGLGYLSFTSSKTASHNIQPDGATVFSVLEGLPHNLVHNCIGGVGPLDPGPYGNMTNFLSPVDPIFFLHHSNIDRLWDVWTRKQMSLDQPFLPSGDDLKQLSEELFLFYVNSDGKPVLDSKAGDYLSMERFDYEYDRLGTGENLIGTSKLVSEAAPPLAAARVAANVAAFEHPASELPRATVAGEPPRPLMAQVTIERPANAREFRVFVGAPADATNLGPDSPHYVGTVGFFGPSMAMPGMQMGHEAKFSLPLPPQLPALAAPLAGAPAQANLAVTVAPIGGNEAAPVLKAASIGTL
jgi:tyrosinase